MPPKPKEEYKLSDVKLAEMAKALAHPARIAILRVLAKRNECICGEIVDILPLAQATVSQHLKVLKEVGLIDGTIDGPRSCYCLNRETLQKADAMFRGFIDVLQSSNDGSK
jgi:DNA-binding transcriptional ArsR family regulator